MKISIRYKLFLSHFLAILLVSGSIGSFFYTAAINNLTHSLKARLKYSAAILSHTFSAQDLDAIASQSEQADAITFGYLAKMRDLVSSNPDVAFIYVMSLNDNQVQFVLDADTEEPAELGEVYEEYIPELIQGFKALSVDSDITTDRWGSFMSGYSPIAGGNTPYMVGIDMRADEVNNKLKDLRRQGLVSLLLSILFAYACASFLSRSMLLRIKTLHDRCLGLSPLKEKVIHQPGDELDGLSNAFDFMLDSVHATHEHLERQVNSRTKELQNTNQKLSEEVEERRRMEKVLKESASTDYLTGLLNRREMTNQLKNAATFNEPFSVIILDIDRFKLINDQLGHDVGDEILRKFARTLLHLAEDHATISRWGGEEFTIFLPSTALENAVLDAERIRGELERIEYGKNTEQTKILASFGVAEHRTGQAWEQTVKNADIALYEAKACGRNKVQKFDS